MMEKRIYSLLLLSLMGTAATHAASTTKIVELGGTYGKIELVPMSFKASFDASDYNFELRNKSDYNVKVYISTTLIEPVIIKRNLIGKIDFAAKAPVVNGHYMIPAGMYLAGKRKNVNNTSTISVTPIIDNAQRCSGSIKNLSADKTAFVSYQHKQIPCLYPTGNLSSGFFNGLDFTNNVSKSDVSSSAK